MQTVKDIRIALAQKLKNQDFIIDKSGSKTIEILGATFKADEPYIIREPNEDYIQRELAWYQSQSLNVNDIPGTTPKIWLDVSSTKNEINSNYGWCVWSKDNGNQYDNVLKELKRNPNSRRAVMIYNRPSMHVDYNKDGMSDFMCTYANTFYIRDNKLVSHYLMRSNDSIFVYNNDFAWAKHVQEELAKDLDIECSDIIWTASNLHVYERHFHLVEEWANNNLYR